MSEPSVDLSRQAGVVLDIGDGVGALVIRTSEDLRGMEIEVSPRGDDNARQHVEVHERRVGDRAVFAAVFPGLSAGTYTIWRAPEERWGEVVIRSGRVEELDWT
ncbi:MAG TPA: hypothetical protein VNY76_02660 [Candidatus Acidoferrales bacterium]|nr:hypothetical protein [Candidatus Acidoferrales bacterium]